jgi:hypothetical protein
VSPFEYVIISTTGPSEFDAVSVIPFLDILPVNGLLPVTTNVWPAREPVSTLPVETPAGVSVKLPSPFTVYVNELDE